MAGKYVMPKGFEENLAMRRRLLWDAAHVPGAAAKLLDACSKDIVFYVNAFGWTYDPRRPKSAIPFITYKYQDEAFEAIVQAVLDSSDVAIKKSRDMGASWILLDAFEWMWRFWDMKSFLLVSRNEDYVDAPGDPKSLFWKIDFTHKHQPRWLLPRGFDAKCRKSMHLENPETGSIIDGESTTGDVGRGDRRTAILLDEFGAFETGAGYNALKATQSATDCRIFNSTPKGSSNAFYDVVHKSSARILTMHWSQHPRKNQGLYTSVRNEATKRMELKLLDDFKGIVAVHKKGEKGSRNVVFPEDYPFVLDGKMRSPWYDKEHSRAVSQAEIAQELDIDFLGSDFQFFDAAAVEAYKAKWCEEPDSIGDLEIDSEACAVLRYTRNAKGKWRFFEPLGPGDRPPDGERYVIGADVCAGTGASNSTLAVYSRRTKRKVAEYANSKILPDDFGKLAVAAARFWNNALIVPDRSGPTGETFVRRVVASGYHEIYRRRDEKKIGRPIADEYGIFLNPAARTTILYQYREAIGSVSMFNCSDIAMDECLKFICTQDGQIEHSAALNSVDPSGARANHGDMVIADALAWLGLSEGGATEKAEESAPPESSVEARRREWKRKQAESRKDKLGKGWKV